MVLHRLFRVGWQKVRSIPRKYLFLGLFLFLAVLYGVIFRERTMTYAYAGKNCDTQGVLLPRLMKQSGSGAYEVSTDDEFSIGNYPIFAASICVEPRTVPQEGSNASVGLSLFGGLFARLSYKINVPQRPEPQLAVFEQPFAASRVLALPLTGADETFQYMVKIEDKQADCAPKGASVLCDIPALKLGQGTQYNLALERYFKEERIETIAQESVTTLSPLSITSSSIAHDATVYDKPTTVVVEVDKPIEKAAFSLLNKSDEAAKKVPLKTTIENSRVTIDLGGELPREVAFELIAEQFEAKDGSIPLDQFVLPFKTSGGPKVMSISADTSGVGLNEAIVISFDQVINDTQDISKLVSVKGVVASVQRRADQVVIQLSGAPKCQDFSVVVSKDLMSAYDIASGSDWSRGQRTTCHTVSTIGYSHRGRAINAYEFGSGSRTVLFVGAIHGSEYSTYSLMTRWIDELELRAREIPADKRIVVVPQINPDGVAQGSRVNARNVDLNRNFATGDWQSDVTTVNNQPFAGGGGDAPMSESETKALSIFASQLRPELTLSYHSIGGLLAANQAGRSTSLASTYSQLSGYRNTTGQTSSTFEYAISGTWDGWLAEKLGLASILIELGSHSYHQFERNQAAMWAMVKS